MVELGRGTERQPDAPEALRGAVDLAEPILLFAQQALVPQQDGTQSERALQQAWTAKIVTDLKKSSLITSPYKNLISARENLIVPPSSLEAACTAADFLFQENLVISPATTYEAQIPHPLFGVAFDYQTAAQATLRILDAARAILGDETSSVTLEEIQHANNHITDEQQQTLAEKLRARLQLLTVEVGGTDSDPLTLLQSAAEDVAVKAPNLLVLNGLDQTRNQYNAITAAISHIPPEYQIAVTDGRALIEMSIGTDRARQAHIAQALQIPLAELPTRLQVYDIYMQEAADSLPKAQRISSLARTLNVLQLHHYSSQTATQRYVNFARQAHYDMQDVSRAITAYFHTNVPGFLDARAQLFGIPTEGRKPEEIANDLNDVGNMVWLTLSAMLDVKTSGGQEQIQAAVAESLNDTSKIFAFPYDTSTLQAIEETLGEPDLEVTFRRSLGSFGAEILRVSPYSENGRQITLEQAEAKLLGHDHDHMEARRTARRDGFIHIQ